MRIYETELTETVLDTLIGMSKDWEVEMSCHGYRANARSDIEGNRVFLAEDDGTVLGYLFGRICRAEKESSVMPRGSAFFEVEELYVIPSRRSVGVGAAGGMLVGTIALLFITPVLTILFIYIDERMCPAHRVKKEDAQ